ncbi:unnamed protein product [Notodromas monacha]|uniref:Uncharacterized protein n=1 Tax=Notodromas monacha TaxID=399045 RepID=A0A7R9BDI6_9CRUS|nr:unnamed protein product [Notodromas monacha]CAG0912653.1 unnamed protein product [Notodromas monacha]
MNKTEYIFWKKSVTKLLYGTPPQTHCLAAEASFDVFSSVESTTTTVAGKDVPPASEELDNPAARKLAEYFSKTTLRRPKLPPPPPPPPRKAKANRVTVTLAEDAEQPGVNSSPVMVVVPAGDDAATVHTHESASSTDTNPVVDYRQLSSCPSDESQSKNVQAPTGGTASNPMSSSYGTSELGKGLPSSIMERYKGAAIRITTCGTIESPAEVVECDYTVSDSSHVGEGQEPGPTCITISATRRSCLSNILVIKNDVELPLAGRGACSILDEDLQKDLEEVEALYEEISEPIYEEVLAEDGSKSTAVEYELCLKRCLLGEDQHVKSLFDGASRDEILMYLEGVRDRAGLVSIDEDPGPLLDVTIGRRNSQNRTSNISTASDSSDDSSTRFALSDFLKNKDRRGSVEVERNDSGVGSETSKPSLTRRYQISSLAPPRPLRTAKSCEGTPPQEEEETLCSSENHTCEDCDLPISNRVVQRILLTSCLECHTALLDPPQETLRCHKRILGKQCSHSAVCVNSPFSFRAWHLLDGGDSRSFGCSPLRIPHVHRVVGTTMPIL